MTYTPEAWKRFTDSISVLPDSISQETLIRESWERCRELGVKRVLDDHVILRRVDDSELQLRLEQNRALLDTAAPLLAQFSQRTVGVQHVVYLTDRDGIVLFSCGNHDVMRAYGLLPGFDWSEDAMGTNGAGTALATRHPVAVIGPDHYQLPFRDATCLASPIRSATGELIGAVDFSTHVEDADISQLAHIVNLAASIEDRLARILTKPFGQPSSDLNPGSASSV
jgi:sigma-54 dependent transcriptional regulator, acetoin dehydrogenase operon transcriptional activator AcoR